MLMKDKRFRYQHIRVFEEAADKCWQLCDFIEDHFVGFESFLKDLRNIAIGFEVEFEKCFE